MKTGNLRGYFFISLILTGLLSSCSGTRPLTEDQYLYSGADIIYDNRKDIRDFRNTNIELQNVLKPKPNSKFLGTRPLLCLHNMIGKPKKESGLKYWFKYKLGQAPVLYEKKLSPNTKLVLENRLKNRGYFNANVAYIENFRKKEVNLKYIVKSHNPYYIESIEFPDGNSAIDESINSLMENSLIKPGDIYNLSILLAERNRIDAELKEIGYYYFDQDYLIYRADSIEGKNSVRLSIDLKKDIPISVTPVKKSTHNCKPVDQFDLNGKFIQRYNSITEAARTLNIDNSLISRCTSGENKTATGFIWKFAGKEIVDKIEIPKKKKGGKLVDQYDMDGNFIKSFDSIAEAGKFINRHPSQISRCCNGKIKSTYGCIWKFFDPSLVQDY